YKLIYTVIPLQSSPHISFPPLFSSRLPRPPTPTLFPYTTLFRSHDRSCADQLLDARPNPSVPRLDGLADQEHEEASQHRRREDRSEEHTSELQSPDHLVCRLLLEKKKQNLT